MTRKRRNRSRRTKSGRRAVPEKPPNVRSLVVWSIPFGVVAIVVDGLLFRHMANHREEFGHWYLPMQGFIFAVMVTGIAISIPVIGILHLRKHRR